MTGTIRVLNDNGNLTSTTDTNGDIILHGALMFEVDGPDGRTITVAIQDDGTICTWADAPGKLYIQPEITLEAEETTISYRDRVATSRPVVVFPTNEEDIEVWGSDVGAHEPHNLTLHAHGPFSWTMQVRDAETIYIDRK